MSRGYDAIYAGLIPKLAACDFKESAERLGVKVVEGNVQIEFLKRVYVITREGAEPLDGQPADANTRSVLIYYLLSKGSGKPENVYVLFENIPRLTGGLGSPIRLMSKSLEREFQTDYDRFARAAAAVGGIEEATQPGRHDWRFDVLPKIPVKITYYEADDEFPVGIPIMLDRTSVKFLEFEVLAFMVGCLTRALVRQGRPS
jgi:hypothetical protein